MRNRFIALFGVFLFFQTFVSAETVYFFYVQLSDKNNTPYSISNPSAFLSQRAIERRVAMGISCDSTDLPLQPNYVNQIANSGVKIHSKSKWLNGLTVTTADTSMIAQIRNLEFVKQVNLTAEINFSDAQLSKIKRENDMYEYGIADSQISQLHGKVLHNQGYTGKDIHIAVIDAGFKNVDINPRFDSLRLQGRLLGTKDIVIPGNNVYAEDSHGANVLSIMAGNYPNQYLGTAPHASYWLIRTEYAPTETRAELDFWVAGIEFADSVGVEVTNTSLGYTGFDLASTNFTYADMNGKVSRASIAATMASYKGIIVTVSAGNDGAKPWKYLSSPADAEDIFTIGAATSTGLPSYFSSFGPSYDGRVKPDLSAMGTSTAYVTSSGNVSTGDGTSYASPVMAGMLACYLQFVKSNLTHYTVADIRQAVLKSASLYTTPSAQLGYGFPDFQVAMNNILLTNNLQNTKRTNIQLLYQTDSKRVKLKIPFELFDNTMRVRIVNLTGNIVIDKLIYTIDTELNTNNLVPGVYVANIYSEKLNSSIKFIVP